MPRTLPWLKDRNAETTSPRVPPPKRRRISPTAESFSSDELPTASGLRTSAKRLNAQNLRSPSTSPAPAPPETHLMRHGDDAWRMVEDEFEATAKLYTLHVHNAEYLRQKALARERESRFGEIARPVVGGLSKEAERHMAVERQRRATLADADEEEVEDPWMGTQLAGLMMGPRRAVKLKARGAGEGRSHTRAAAGFDSARGGSVTTLRKESVLQDTTDDDLDAPVRLQTQAKAEKKQIIVRVEKKHTQRPALPSRTELRSASSDISPPQRNRNTTSRNALRSTSSDISPPPRRKAISKNKPSRRPLESSDPPTTPENPPRKPSSSKRDPSSTRAAIQNQSRSKDGLIKPETLLNPFNTTEIEMETGFPSIPLPSTKPGSSVLARRREARLKREKEEKEKAEAKTLVHELPTFLF